MALIKANLIRDTADALGIDDHSLVEKDFYAVQVLKALGNVESPVFKLVFAGGTAMSKALVPLNRMSEDIDVKLIVRHDAPVHLLTRNQLRKERRAVVASATAAIEKIDGLHVASKLSRRESGFNQLMVAYPAQFGLSGALRPAVQLELVHSEDRLPLPDQPKSIRSYIAEASQQPAEVEHCPTVSLELTLAEKLVSLGRRTADKERNPLARPDDQRLIRHAYDLHKAHEHGFDFSKIGGTVKAIVEHDRQQFKAQHSELANNAIEEITFGLSKILTDPEHKRRFERMVVPLVYGTGETPKYDAIAESLVSICQAVGFDLGAQLLNDRALEAKAQAANELLRNETTTRKEEILAPFNAKREPLDQAVREAAGALASHQNTSKPSGFFSGKAAKSWEDKRTSLLKATTSANRDLLKHRQQKQILEKDAQGVARKEAERQNPQAVKDQAMWNGRQKEGQELKRQQAQSNNRTGPRR